MSECLNKEIYKNKVPKPTPDAASAEITTKVTTDNTVEITIKCKECNFTGRSWSDLREHKWTECSEDCWKKMQNVKFIRKGPRRCPRRLPRR